MNNTNYFKLLTISTSKDVKNIFSEICYGTKSFQINCEDKIDVLENVLDYKVSLIIIHTDIGVNEITDILDTLHQDDEFKRIPVAIISELESNEQLSMVLFDYPVIAIYTYKTWHVQVKSLIHILKKHIDEESILHDDIEATNKANLMDPLTGVYNRRGGEKVFANYVRDYFSNNETFSFIAIDIDHFKKINDTHGHNVGDEVLIEMSDYFIECIRQEDSFVRFGGEEFGLFFCDCDLMPAVQRAEGIRKAISEKLFSSLKLCVTVSMGVTEYKEGVSLDRLVSNADELLYKAKSEGRNRVNFTKE